MHRITLNRDLARSGLVDFSLMVYILTPLCHNVASFLSAAFNWIFNIRLNPEVLKDWIFNIQCLVKAELKSDVHTITKKT